MGKFAPGNWAECHLQLYPIYPILANDSGRATRWRAVSGATALVGARRQNLVIQSHNVKSVAGQKRGAAGGGSAKIILPVSVTDRAPM